MAKLITPDLNENDGQNAFEIVERGKKNIHEEDPILDAKPRGEKFVLKEGINLIKFDEEYEFFKVRSPDGEDRYRYKFTGIVLTKGDEHEGKEVAVFLPLGTARSIRQKMREYPDEPLIIERTGTGPGTRYTVRSLTEWNEMQAKLTSFTKENDGGGEE